MKYSAEISSKVFALHPEFWCDWADNFGPILVEHLTEDFIYQSFVVSNQEELAYRILKNEPYLSSGVSDIHRLR